MQMAYLFDEDFRRRLDMLLSSCMRTKTFSLVRAEKIIDQEVAAPKIARGYHKLVFRAGDWVVKVGSSKTIAQDKRVYDGVFDIDREWFASTYFGKYHEIQQFGEVPVGFEFFNAKKRLQEIAKRNGVVDIRKPNVRVFKGTLKIVDGNPRRIKS